jgi:hypothetical protein
MSRASEETLTLRSKIKLSVEDSHLKNLAIWFDKHKRPCVTLEGKNIKLHYLIMPKIEGKIIDHIDGNIFNNERTNLRYCTHSQNLFNRKKRKESFQVMKGIQKLPSGKFRAKGPNGVHWGVFVCPLVAYNQFLKKSKELWGHDFVVGCKNI